MKTPERFERALAAIDAANAGDPIIASGADLPRAVLYGRRMSARLALLAPDASEILQLAARAQHIRRWAIARDEFPEGREGYHRWRRRLYAFHAEMAAEVLEATGYGEATITRVGELLRKRRLNADPEAQTLEDVACLVFLEHELAEFATKHHDEKLIDILRRTWKKMSPRGQAAALTLDLPSQLADLVRCAVDT